MDRQYAYIELHLGNGLVALRLVDGIERSLKPLKTPESMQQHRGVGAAVSGIAGVLLSGAMGGMLRAVSTGNRQTLREFDVAREFVNGVSAEGGSIGAGGPLIADGMVFAGSYYVGFQNGVPGNVLLAFAPSFSVE